MKKALRAVALAAAVITAGCSSGNGTGGSQTRPRSTAKLEIVNPSPGASEEAGKIEVKLALEGGRITKKVTSNIKPDVGHIHLRLDGETITLLGSLDQKIDVKKKGPHLLQAEFVAADHGPFDPRILSAVNFTVR